MFKVFLLARRENATLSFWPAAKYGKPWCPYSVEVQHQRNWGREKKTWQTVSEFGTVPRNYARHRNWSLKSQIVPSLRKAIKKINSKVIKNGDLTKSVRSASNQRRQNGESRMEFICASKALRPAQKKLLNLAKISDTARLIPGDLWNINLARIVGGDSESLSLTWDTAMVGARTVGGDSESGSGQSLSLHSLDSVLWPIRDPIWLAPLSFSLWETYQPAA